MNRSAKRYAETAIEELDSAGVRDFIEEVKRTPTVTLDTPLNGSGHSALVCALLNRKPIEPVGGRAFQLFTAEPGRVKNAKKTCGGNAQDARRILAMQWRDMPEADQGHYYDRVKEMERNVRDYKMTLLKTTSIIMITPHCISLQCAACFGLVCMPRALKPCALSAILSTVGSHAYVSAPVA